jgi:hypothetical protein
VIVDQTKPIIDKKVLIVCPYPKGAAPGQRFRFEQYLGLLKNAGIHTEIAPFLSDDVCKILYKPGLHVKKALGVVDGFSRRVGMLFKMFRYDYIFVHREAAPIGPPIIEALMFLARRKVIYDFDDAIFVPQYSKANPIVGALRCSSKVSFIARHSQKVSVCNPYLVDWVSQRNTNVYLVPTTIDENSHRSYGKLRDAKGPVVIGWTGSHSTAKYLKLGAVELKLTVGCGSGAPPPQPRRASDRRSKAELRRSQRFRHWCKG